MGHQETMATGSALRRILLVLAVAAVMAAMMAVSAIPAFALFPDPGLLRREEVNQ
jgi:hypothetical protein